MPQRNREVTLSEEELHYRRTLVRWMSRHEWPPRVCDRIFMEDDPPLEVVQELIQQHGGGALMFVVQIQEGEL